MEVEAGDLVFVKNDLEEVKKNQEGFGGWHPQMAEVFFLSCGSSDKEFNTKLPFSKTLILNNRSKSVW